MARTSAAMKVCWLALAALGLGWADAPAAPQSAPTPRLVILPLERTAYFVGEQVPMALDAPEGFVRLEAAGADGRILLYAGPRAPLRLDTSRLAPGDYRLELDGREVLPRLTMVSPLRHSPASLQDETPPREPQFSGQKPTPQQRRQAEERHWDDVVRMLKDSGINAVFHMAAEDTPRQGCLDALARAGAILLANPDTRPTSFFPTRNAPEELDSMGQRLILAAQANGRHPNFGGFCYGWDTTGYALGGRRGLMTYWGWGDKTDDLRRYIDRIDGAMSDIFTRRSGLQPVTEAEYLPYLLSIRRPEFGTAIDLPTKLWLEEIARHSRPMDEAQRRQFERRLDAWSAYLMNMHNEVYGAFSRELRGVYPSMHHAASVQVDHAAVRFGQYFPLAYAPLDLHYQSAWNDQVGGPDYAYQWLLTAALLNMHRGDKPTWISTSLAAAHGRAAWPGKFARVAAHGLAHGAVGVGFALEGFSNVLGGMNRQTQWENLRGTAGEADLAAGREFLERFAAVGLAGRGDHGVGILFSRSQFQRQHAVMGFGTPHYKALVVLTRLGYTPRFVTEEDLVAGRTAGLRALVVLGQTFPLPPDATAAIERFVKAGGAVLADGNTTEKLPGAEPLGLALPLSQPGKPHNWGAPNIAEGDNDALMCGRWHAALAAAFAKALGRRGRGILAAEKGPDTCITLMQIDGGQATYIVAINDSHIRTQADWRQVRERLLPTDSAPGEAALYDCTDEKPLGRIGPVDCGLSATTVRLLCAVRGGLGGVDLAASQGLAVGQELTVRVGFRDGGGRALLAVVPFHLAIRRPGGGDYQDFYRATSREGEFSMAVPIPANAPPGEWSVTVRCQLDGSTATLPVRVGAANPATHAAAIQDPAILRGRGAIDGLLQRGGRLVVPIFASPRAEQLAAVAEKLKATLAAKGVEVEVRRDPPITTYTLAYDLDEAQRAANAKADRGEAFGRIRRETVNRNDWFSALSGWRFGRPVVLLDLAGVEDNPVAESLGSQGRPPRDVGLLWPAASAEWPGPGRAVVQGIRWAFAPHVDAIVIQAADVEGLAAGAAALADPPADWITPSIEAAREELWRQRHVGGAPNQPKAAGLTAKGLATGRAPRPMAMRFPDARPPTAGELQPSAPLVRAATAVPVTFGPKQFVPYMLDGNTWIEAGTASSLIGDLRFSQGILVVADVRQPGRMRVAVQGVFRTSDRKPMWQAQWEDVIELYDKTVPKIRRPMEIEVLVGGRSIGRLAPARTEQREVPLEQKARFSNEKPRTAVEEVVTELAGQVDLTAGRQEVLLVHRHIVDGKLTAVEMGARPKP